MREEFHGNGISGTDFKGKQLYGWNTLNPNVWLPSVIELVGYDVKNYRESTGTYFSAMQGLNTSDHYYADAQGGTQFAYFKQYNASGGGEKIWTACNKDYTWLRSPDFGQNHAVMTYSGAHGISSNQPATGSHAVHPAVLGLHIVCEGDI